MLEMDQVWVTNGSRDEQQLGCFTSTSRRSPPPRELTVRATAEVRSDAGLVLEPVALIPQRSPASLQSATQKAPPPTVSGLREIASWDQISIFSAI